MFYFGIFQNQQECLLWMLNCWPWFAVTEIVKNPRWKKIDFLKGDTLNSRVYICYALSCTNAQTLHWCRLLIKVKQSNVSIYRFSFEWVQAILACFVHSCLREWHSPAYKYWFGGSVLTTNVSSVQMTGYRKADVQTVVGIQWTRLTLSC